MDGRTALENTGSFLALGDSFTEGLNDRVPGHGAYRGWADRFADLLAADQPGLRYANLAIRGKLLGEVAAEQVPRAVELRPDLVSLAAGGNDILRPGSDPDVLAQTFDEAVAQLRGAGCQVLLFTGFDPSAFPVIRMLRGKVAAYNMHLRAIAAARDCVLVDLWTMQVLLDRRMWSADRLHLNPEGHRRVALFAAETAGVPVPADWRAPVPEQSYTGQALPGQVPRPVAGAAAVAAAGAGEAVGRLRARINSARDRAERTLAWMSARQQDTRWAVEYAVPWVRRRLARRSSGDGVPPKRPELLPWDALSWEALSWETLSGLSPSDPSGC
jgi:lysophospholipase L1-like esterase